jgi:hypothetical protein
MANIGRWRFYRHFGVSYHYGKVSIDYKLIQLYIKVIIMGIEE